MKKENYLKTKIEIKKAREEKDEILNGVDNLVGGGRGARNNNRLYNRYFVLEKRIKILNKKLVRG